MMLLPCQFFPLNTSYDHGNRYLALGLFGIHSTAVSMCAYSSIGICVLDISVRVSNLFLTVDVYLFSISLLVSEDQS